MKVGQVIITGLSIIIGLLAPPNVAHAWTAEPLAVSDRFELLDIDTLLYVDNSGLTRILLEVNGAHFKLTTDPVEAGRSANAFVIPEFGDITINIAALIEPGDNNYMEVASQGPPGADALLIVGDLLLPGEEIAFAIHILQPIPDAFALSQNYPNPFSAETTINYRVPLERSSGVHVRIDIYDVAGRRVHTLLDEVRFPGAFSVRWDGHDGSGRRASAGAYIVRFVGDGVSQTRIMALLR